MFFFWKYLVQLFKNSYNNLLPGRDENSSLSLGDGISSFVTNPTGAGESLKECLDIALSVIPDRQRRTTPVYLGATAGMRLLRWVISNFYTALWVSVDSFGVSDEEDIWCNLKCECFHIFLLFKGVLVFWLLISEDQFHELAFKPTWNLFPVWKVQQGDICQCKHKTLVIFWYTEERESFVLYFEWLLHSN